MPKMPNSVREIHAALRQLKPRIRYIKGTDGATHWTSGDWPCLLIWLIDA